MKEVMKGATKDKKIILALIISCIIVLVIVYEVFWNDVNKDCKVSINNNESVQCVEEPPENIEVYIVGCVNNPGTYEIPKNTTINKLAQMAGGFTQGADLEKINLVYKIKDNTMVVIKDKMDNKQKQDEPAMKIVKSIYEEDTCEDLEVNINTASKDKLTELPGIGASVAKKIVKYREDNGAFESIEELMNIPGIGESKFNSIKDMIII